MVADARQTNSEMMENWVIDFDSWDVCDQVCSKLFVRSALVLEKINEWVVRDEQFVKRAGYALMAQFATKGRKMKDEVLIGFLPIIIEGSTDERNMVKKSVNWALRQIGKKNLKLNQLSIQTAEIIAQNKKSASAKWIAADALRELRSEAVQGRLKEV